MLDIKLIREQPDAVRQRLATRGAGDEEKIDQILALDEQRRKRLVEAEQWKASRNRVSKEIGALMAQKKAAEAEARKAETGQMGKNIATLDKAIAEVEQQREALLLQLPNLPHASVKIGRSAADNTEVRVWGARRSLASSPKRTSNCASRSGWWISRARRRFPAADFCFTRIGERGWNGR